MKKLLFISILLSLFSFDADAQSDVEPVEHVPEEGTLPSEPNDPSAYVVESDSGFEEAGENNAEATEGLAEDFDSTGSGSANIWETLKDAKGRQQEIRDRIRANSE